MSAVLTPTRQSATGLGRAGFNATRVLTWGRVLALVWAIAAAYGLLGLRRGWVPHDEGLLGQTADRVLAGEVPHRDFDDVYTGGLAYLNAAAFRVLGDRLISLRFVLFGAYLLWIPAVYYIASRFGSPPMAGGVTLLAAAWSIPIYPAALPSWYNLFLAVFGVAAVLRSLETDDRRWMFVGGLAGGLSCLFKIVGLYYVAGVILFLVFREQNLAWTTTPRGTTGRGHHYPVALGVGLSGFGVALASVFARRFGLAEAIAFLAPPLSIAATLAWRELQRPPAGDGVRFTTMLSWCAPFLAGVLLPLGAFLAFYAAVGGVTGLMREVFVLPGRRLESASFPLPTFDLASTAPIPILLCLVLADWRRIRGLIITVLLGTILAVMLVWSNSLVLFYQVLWRGALYAVPCVVAAAAYRFRVGSDGSDLRRQGAMLLLCVTALFGLIQIPFSAPAYFCYTAPLASLAIAAVFAERGRTSHPQAAILLLAYALFATFRLTPGYLYSLGVRYTRADLTAPLLLPRAADLRVLPREAAAYDTLVPLVRQHASGGAIFAAPDCPEVYYLAGLSNPTPVLYDFLADPPVQDDRVLQLLVSDRINVVVINTAPGFSRPLSSALHDAISRRFPYAESVGQFEVRWLRDR